MDTAWSATPPWLGKDAAAMLLMSMQPVAGGGGDGGQQAYSGMNAGERIAISVLLQPRKLSSPYMSCAIELHCYHGFSRICCFVRNLKGSLEEQDLFS